MPFESDQEKSEIEIKKINSLPTRKIPYIPNIVKEDNLQPDTFKLLSEEAIKKIKAQNLPAGKYKKNMKIADADLEGVPVSVLVTEDLETKEKRYFAFNPGAPLGGGGYGKVRLGQDLDTGKWFAIKLQKESKVAKKEHEIITKMESNLTSPVRKKHLKDKEGKRELEESKQRIMVMEYVPGMSLQEFRFLKKNDKNSESVYINVAEAAIAALNELFKKGILHRDIKLANLMFNILTEKVNVIDLGLALQGELGTPKKEGLAEGTPAYMAPELFNKWLSGDETKVTYNEATEVFALGKALAELLRLTVSDPYPDKLQDVNGKEIKEVPDRREYLNKTRMLRILTPDEFNNSSSITDEKTRAQIQNPVIKDEKMRSQLIDFLNKMTADDPMDRPTYTQSLEFFSQLKKDFEIEKKLQEMPKKIALLDYEVFSDINSELDDENALEKLYLYLKGFDEVKLSIDSSKNITDLALINFKRTLEAQGIPLKEEVFERSNTSELLEQLKQSTLNKQDIYENITTDLILNQVLETNKTIKIDNTKSEMEDKKYEQKTHEKDQLSSKEEAQQLTYLIDNISTLWDALNLPEKNDFEIMSDISIKTLENLDDENLKNKTITEDEKLKIISTLRDSFNEFIKDILTETADQIIILSDYMETNQTVPEELKEQIIKLGENDYQWVIAAKAKEEKLEMKADEMDQLINKVFSIKGIKTELYGNKETFQSTSLINEAKSAPIIESKAPEKIARSFYSLFNMSRSAPTSPSSDISQEANNRNSPGKRQT